MKAKSDPTATTVGSKEFRLRDLVGELHNRLGEVLALVGCVSAVAGMTEATPASLGRLRHVVIAAEEALRDVQEITNELRQAVRS